MVRICVCSALVLLLMLSACGNQQKSESASPQATAKTSATMVKDPVCGMDVDSTSAVKTAFEGKTYYFCSDFDKKQFDGNPSKFVAAIKK